VAPHTTSTPGSAASAARPRGAALACAAALALGAAACGRACAADPPARPAATRGAKADVAEAGAASDAGRAPAPPADGRETEGQIDGESYRMRLFGYDLASTELSIVDVEMKSDLAPVVSADARALFATNGGFFGKQNEPVGLAESGKKRLAGFSRAMSGGVVTVDEGRASLTSTESFDPAARHDFALQCKPRLVVAGAVNIRSDDGKRAERTALCLRRGGREVVFALVVNAQGGPSLLATAKLLAEVGCEDALNLDGGPSTGAAWREGALVQSAPPRGGIRHAVVVRKKAEP